MAHAPKSYFTEKTMRLVRGMARQAAADIASDEFDASQLSMFPDDDAQVRPHRGKRVDAGGVPMTPKIVEHYSRVLMAKYLSRCLGQPLSIIAELLRVNDGTASRLVRTQLPMTTPPLPVRTNDDRVMHEVGMNRARKRRRHKSTEPTRG